MSKTHPTTRRGVIAALGFGGVSLYALWTGYGAAPGPWSLLGLGVGHAEGVDDGHGSGEGAAHDGHGSGGADSHGGGADLAAFRQKLADFVQLYRLPDGSVYPRVLAADALGDSHGHGHGTDDHAAAPVAAAGPLDVYMLAEKWSYEPTVLRLDAGQRYRFRMMAADVSHGASIQFGRGGRMIRLRPNTAAELEITFQRPGRYLVYCTVYCGLGHDLMQARIDVV